MRRRPSSLEKFLLLTNKGEISPLLLTNPGTCKATLWSRSSWEALGCALCLLTASAIPRAGPVWGWGFCPGSRRPRARVPLVVWAWDLVIIRLHCCGPPAPARRQFFALRFATVCH